MEHSEEERLDAIRDWWKRWGKIVIAALVAAMIAIVGGRYWMEQQAAEGEAASTLYGRMMLLAESEDWSSADDMARRLMEDFARTPYGPMAAMVRARAAVAGDDPEAALDHLSWAEGRAEPTPLRTLATLRRARILLDMGEAEEALDLARRAAEDEGAYRSMARELEGDALLRLERPEEALAAWREARATGGSATLGMKIDDLAGQVEGNDS